MNRMTFVVVAAAMVLAVGHVPVEASSRETPKCHEVDADFKSEVTGEGCPEGALCAAGTIKHDSVIRGPMFVTITALAPTAGIPSEPPTVASVAGTRVLKPLRGGELVAHVIGIALFDPATGLLATFQELNLVTGGTGRFAGASGILQVFGQATGPTTFAGEMRGTLCVP